MIFSFEASGDEGVGTAGVEDTTDTGVEGTWPLARGEAD